MTFLTFTIGTITALLVIEGLIRLVERLPR